MTVHDHRSMGLFAAVVALLAAVAAGVGLFARGDGSYEMVTSVRGVTYAMATGGVYANNALRVVSEGVGWDAFTLFVAVPMMLIAGAWMAEGSFRGRLFVAGLFGYLLYQYLEYAMTWAFGPLFPLFIGIFGASLIGLIWIGSSLVADDIASRFRGPFPDRQFAVATFVMAGLLTVLWTRRIAAGLTGDLEAAGLEGETTLVVQALDLGIVVPISVLIAALTWRHSPVGRVLATIYVVTSIAMSAAIVAMLMSAGIATGSFELPPMIMFGGFLAVMIVLASRMYRLTPAFAARTKERGLGWLSK